MGKTAIQKMFMYNLPRFKIYWLLSFIWRPNKIY